MTRYRRPTKPVSRKLHPSRRSWNADGAKLSAVRCVRAQRIDKSAIVTQCCSSLWQFLFIRLAAADEEDMQRIHRMENQIADLEAQLDIAQQETTATKKESDKALAEMRRQMERAM